MEKSPSILTNIPNPSNAGVSLSVNLRRRIAIVALVISYFAVHGSVIASAVGSGALALREAFQYLDSGWYTHLALQGYTTPEWWASHPGSQFAFFPLWPIVLNGVSHLINPVDLAFAGSLISAVCFILTLIALWRYSKSQIENGSPKHLLGTNNPVVLFPLVFAPGAWVYFSNHTEACFLLVSVLAFQQAYRGRLLIGSLLAGLAAITRNQGVLVAICVGLVFLCAPSSTHPGNNRSRFILSGFISGFVFALWLLFLYQKTGSPFTSIDAQHHWGKLDSGAVYLSNMLWLSPNSAPRAFWFWAILVATIGTIKHLRREFIPIGAYLLLSILLWPTQGNNFPQAYRFGAVLFPFWLMIGHWLDSQFRSASRLRWTLGGLTMVGLVIASAQISSYYYLKSAWPY